MKSQTAMKMEDNEFLDVILSQSKLLLDTQVPLSSVRLYPIMNNYYDLSLSRQLNCPHSGVSDPFFESLWQVTRATSKPSAIENSLDISAPDTLKDVLRKWSMLPASGVVEASHADLLLLALWLSHSNIVVPCIEATCGNISYIGHILTSLLAVLNDPTRSPATQSISVTCLAFLVEHHHIKASVLAPTNLRQLLRLCLSRVVYPTPSDSEGGEVPWEVESALCRIAIRKLMTLEGTMEVSIVVEELIAFSDKWVTRLIEAVENRRSAYATPGKYDPRDASVVTTTRNALETITDMLEEFAVMREWMLSRLGLRLSIGSASAADQKSGDVAAMLTAYACSSDPRTVVAGCRLLSCIVQQIYIDTVTEEDSVPSNVRSIVATIIVNLHGALKTMVNLSVESDQISEPVLSDISNKMEGSWLTGKGKRMSASLSKGRRKPSPSSAIAPKVILLPAISVVVEALACSYALLACGSGFEAYNSLLACISNDGVVLNVQHAVGMLQSHCDELFCKQRCLVHEAVIIQSIKSIVSDVTASSTAKEEKSRGKRKSTQVSSDKVLLQARARLDVILNQALPAEGGQIFWSEYFSKLAVENVSSIASWTPSVNNDQDLSISRLLHRAIEPILPVPKAAGIAPAKVLADKEAAKTFSFASHEMSQARSSMGSPAVDSPPIRKLRQGRTPVHYSLNHSKATARIDQHLPLAGRATEQSVSRREACVRIESDLSPIAFGSSSKMWPTNRSEGTLNFDADATTDSIEGTVHTDDFSDKASESIDLMPLHQCLKPSGSDQCSDSPPHSHSDFDYSIRDQQDDPAEYQPQEVSHFYKGSFSGRRGEPNSVIVIDNDDLEDCDMQADQSPYMLRTGESPQCKQEDSSQRQLVYDSPGACVSTDDWKAISPEQHWYAAREQTNDDHGITRQELLQLRKERDASSEELNRQRGLMDDMSLESTSLTAEVAFLRAELATRDKQLTEAKMTTATVTAKCKQLEEVQALQEQTLQSAWEQIAALTKMESEHRLETSALRQLQGEMSDQMSTLEGRERTLRLEATKWSAQKINLQESLNSRDVRLSETSAQLSRLQQQLLEKDHDSRVLRRNANDAASRISQLEHTLQDREAIVKQSVEEISQLKNQVSSLSREQLTLTKAKESLQLSVDERDLQLADALQRMRSDSEKARAEQQRHGEEQVLWREMETTLRLELQLAQEQALKLAEDLNKNKELILMINQLSAKVQKA